MALLAQLVDGVVVHKFAIDNDGVTIGRLPQNDIMIDDTSVSSQHAKVYRLSNPDFPESVEFYVEDLGSTNGTELNGVKLKGKAQLHHEDEVKIAWNTFKFIDQNTQNLEKTVHILE